MITGGISTTLSNQSLDPIETKKKLSRITKIFLTLVLQTEKKISSFKPMNVQQGEGNLKAIWKRARSFFFGKDKKKIPNVNEYFMGQTHFASHPNHQRVGQEIQEKISKDELKEEIQALLNVKTGEIEEQDFQKIFQVVQLLEKNIMRSGYSKAKKIDSLFNIFIPKKMCPHRGLRGLCPLFGAALRLHWATELQPISWVVFLT